MEGGKDVGSRLHSTGGGFWERAEHPHQDWKLGGHAAICAVTQQETQVSVSTQVHLHVVKRPDDGRRGFHVLG